MSENRPAQNLASPELKDPAARGLDGGADQAAPGTDLSKNEIDALVKASGEARQSLSHPMAALGVKSESAPVHLPMLEPIFDRVARSAETHLRNFYSDNVSCVFEGIKFMQLRDFIDRVEMPSITAVLRSGPWHTTAVMTMTSRLIYATVDHLLGGRSSQTPRLEGRSFSTIERKLMDRLARIFVQAFDGAFTMIPPPTFSVERMELVPRFAVVSALSQKMLVVRFTINVNDRGGPTELAIPLISLLPFKDALGVLSGTEDNADERERDWMAKQAHGVSADVVAVVSERLLFMDEILSWRPGSSFDLDTSVSVPLTIYVNGTALFRATMGRRGTHYAIQIMEALPESPRRGSRIYLPEELESGP